MILNRLNSYYNVTVMCSSFYLSKNVLYYNNGVSKNKLHTHNQFLKSVGGSHSMMPSHSGMWLPYSNTTLKFHETEPSSSWAQSSHMATEMSRVWLLGISHGMEAVSDSPSEGEVWSQLRRFKRRHFRRGLRPSSAAQAVTL